ncbi:MAG: hypothetical protein OXG78_17380 [Chloroflexi bacterium]|nr:hypothetical protein [Chloroflexota bacterium]
MKVLIPVLLTRVKKPRRFVCERANRGDIGAVLDCDNMISVEIYWLSASAKAAILAASARPLKNKTALLC